MSKTLEIFNSMKQHLRGNVADHNGIMALVNGANSLSRHAQDLEAERDRLRKINRELVASLTETLRALEQHLDDDTNEHGLKHRDHLCPCNSNEVPRARAALAKAKETT